MYRNFRHVLAFQASNSMQTKMAVNPVNDYKLVVLSPFTVHIRAAALVQHCGIQWGRLPIGNRLGLQSLRHQSSS